MISPTVSRTHLLRWPLLGLLLVALLSTSTIAQAQSPQVVEIVDLKVGFSGSFAVGKWTPVTVTIQGGAQNVTGHVQLIVPDGEGLPSRVTSPRPYQLLSGGSVRVPLFAKFGRIENEVRVRFVDLSSGDVFAQRRFDAVDLGGSEGTSVPWAMYSGQELIVSLGPPVGIDEAIRLHQREEREKIEHAALDSVDDLPTRWYGYEGVSALVLSTSQPEILDSLTSTSDRLTALDEWVERGGRLVIFAGTQAPAMFGKSGPLARFAPGTLKGVTTLPQTNELEAYSELPEPLSSGRGGAAGIPAAQFGNVRGRVEVPDAPQADLPLVVRTPYGLGEVVYVAVDLDQQPFAGWKARGQFVNKLLAMPAAGSKSEDKQGGGQVTSTGLTDLLSQLRGSLDQFGGIVLVPFWIVAVLVACYIALIGPGDYLLVKKVFKRMEMTWITFPAIVLLVSGGAYLAAATLKGKELRLNQVDLVDVVLDKERPIVRGTTWLNLFSPRADAYDFAYTPQLPGGQAAEEGEARVLLSWLGLPGSALGGMEPRVPNQPLVDQPYDFTPQLDRLQGMPINVWSTRSLTAQWTSAEAAGFKAKVSLGSDDGLDGELTNELGLPLTNCWLAYDRWVYPLETIEAGQTIDLAARWKDREVLLSRLTRNRVEEDTVKKQFISVTSPYDHEGFDVPTILRQMMFYQASGGFQYAGLLNRYQSTIDLSGHLKLGRAILVGFSDRPAGTLQRSEDGGQSWPAVQGPEDRHWTCYRFVIPIEAPVKN